MCVHPPTSYSSDHTSLLILKLSLSLSHPYLIGHLTLFPHGDLKTFPFPWVWLSGLRQEIGHLAEAELA